MQKNHSSVLDDIKKNFSLPEIKILNKLKVVIQKEKKKFS